MKKLLAAILAAAMVLSLAACGSSSESSSSSTTAAATEAEAADTGAEAEEEPAQSSGSGKDSLTIYTCYPEDEIVEIIEKFKEDTGIQLEYVRFSAGEIYARILAEKDNPQASVVCCISSEVYMNSMNDGLLYSYQSGNVESVDPMFLLESDDVDNSAWNPTSTSPLCLIINTDWFEDHPDIEIPKTWDDLLKPEYKGEIIIPHPSTSGIAYTFLSTIMQLYGEDEGWDYFSKLKENVSQFTSAGSGTPTAISLGEGAIGVTYIADGYKPIDEGYPCELVYLDSPVGYDTSGMSILANGPVDELDNAKTFVDWFVSEQGQQVFKSSHRIPVNKNVSFEGAPSLSDVNTMDYDVIWSGEHRNELIEEFTEKIDGATNLK